MPIRQETLLTLMSEARANITNHQTLMHNIAGYLANAKVRHAGNVEALAIIQQVQDFLEYQQPMQEKWLERNEYHYRRVRKANEDQRARAERTRRGAGIPTQEEALAILHAKNALRRQSLPTDAESYMTTEEQTARSILGQEEIDRQAAERKFYRDFAEFQRTRGQLLEPHIPTNMAQEEWPVNSQSAGKTKIIFPRTSPDDKPLEFETLPQDENNSPQPTFGLDIPADPYDNDT